MRTEKNRSAWAWKIVRATAPDARPSANDRTQSVSRPANRDSRGARAFQAPRNRKEKTSADTSAARNARIESKMFRRSQSHAARSSQRFERVPESKAKRTAELRPVAADVPDSAQRPKSFRLKAPCIRAQATQTLHTHATPPPIRFAEFAQGPAAQILSLHPAATPESLQWNRDRLASSSRSFRNHLCQFRFRANFPRPFRNGPGLSPCRLLQTPLRIHGERFSDTLQHPLVLRAVPVHAAFRQIQFPFLRVPPHRYRFRFAEHRPPEHAASPAPIFFFEPRRAYVDFRGQISLCQLAAKPIRDFLREKFQCACYQHDSVSIRGVPRGTFHRFRKKRRIVPRTIRAETGRTNRAQILLVSLQRMGEAVRQQPHKFGEPRNSVSQRNLSFAPQRSKISPLERRHFRQRSVDVKKSRAIHAVPLAIPVLRAGAAVVRARYFQPSINTGSPRTTQNAAVAQVNTCASVRMVMCMSPATVPSSATGPRVSANSRPR